MHLCDSLHMLLKWFFNNGYSCHLLFLAVQYVIYSVSLLTNQVYNSTIKQITSSLICLKAFVLLPIKFVMFSLKTTNTFLKHWTIGIYHLTEKVEITEATVIIHKNVKVCMESDFCINFTYQPQSPLPQYFPPSLLPSSLTPIYSSEWVSKASLR